MIIEIFIAKRSVYNAWLNMMRRCYNKNNDNYKWYGDRGICVEPQWHIFLNFKNDMEPSYIEGYSLERINNDGNYEASNCTWIPTKLQHKNTRRNVFIVLPNGDKLNFNAACDYFGIEKNTANRQRLGGISLTEVFNVDESFIYTPPINKGNGHFNKVKNKPTKEVLEVLVKTKPMTHVGKVFGVSDNAVKKWCKKYGIVLPKMRGFWQKVSVGKIIIDI